MKRALIILVYGLMFNSFEQNTSNLSIHLQDFNLKNDLILEKSNKVSPYYFEKDCGLINEWLNRKSIGNFMQNIFLMN